MPKSDIDWDDPTAVAKARGDFSDDDNKSGVGDNTDDADAAAAAAAAAKDADDDADADAKDKEADKDGDEKDKDDAGQKDKGDDKAKEGEGADKDKEGAEGDADADVDAKGVMIPKSRYDSVKGRLNEAEARIKEIDDAEVVKRQAQVDADARTKADADDKEATIAKQAQVDELDELEGKYMKHLKDGEDDEALAIRKQIRVKEQAIYHQDAETQAAKARDEAVTVTKAGLDLDATYDYVEENFAVLNPEHDDFDQKLVDEVQELRAGFMATGKYSETDALLRAVKVIVPEIKDVPGTTGEIDEAAKKVAEDKRNAKKKADVEKALDTASKQPTDMKGGEDSNKGGKDTPDPKPSQLTRSDFNSLPEEAKKRMRGDFTIPTE